MPPWELKKTYQRETVDPCLKPENQRMIRAFKNVGYSYQKLRSISPDDTGLLAIALRSLSKDVKYATVLMREHRD